MNSSKDSFDWNQVRAFLATVDEGSLSAAARSLGQTQPTLGRQVAALEADLGVTLFERVGRSLRLTTAGAELLTHVRTMADAANRVSLVASGQAQAIEGRVRITASDMVASEVLPPIIATLVRSAPRLQIEVIAANNIQDILKREADIAVRHVRPDQPDLIARLVRENKALFYASRSFLDRMGRPQDIADLQRFDFVGIGDDEEMFRYYRPMGLHLTSENIRVTTANFHTAWEFARLGLGVIPMEERIARLYPEMEPVLPGMDPIMFPVWLTTHRELHTSRRIRLVFDHLAKHLAKLD